MTCDTEHVTLISHLEDPEDAEDWRELWEDAAEDCGVEDGAGWPSRQNQVPFGQQ